MAAARRGQTRRARGQRRAGAGWRRLGPTLTILQAARGVSEEGALKWPREKKTRLVDWRARSCSGAPTPAGMSTGAAGGEARGCCKRGRHTGGRETWLALLRGAAFGLAAAPESGDRREGSEERNARGQGQTRPDWGADARRAEGSMGARRPTVRRIVQGGGGPLCTSMAINLCSVNGGGEQAPGLARPSLHMEPRHRTAGRAGEREALWQSAVAARRHTIAAQLGAPASAAPPPHSAHTDMGS